MIGHMTLSQLLEPCAGEILNSDAEFNSVSIDSRKMHKGELFVAISGQNFDGHAFFAEVESKGAVAAVVSRATSSSLPQLVVKDTTKALGSISRINRQRSGAKVIALTGSQGKTTVKGMTGNVLSRMAPTLVTTGNLNNEIGVPLTLLLLSEEHLYAVIELGANHPGEIAYSAEITAPDIAAITNAAHAHIEGFGSIDGVAESKGEIIDKLKPEGTMVLNADDRYFDVWLERAGQRRTVSFSVSSSRSEYYASDLIRQESGCFSFTLTANDVRRQVNLGVMGRHNVINAVASAALSIEAGANLDQVVAGLESFVPVDGRLATVAGIHQSRIIDDTYNASPESFEAAIDLLAGYEGKRILIMGDMAELGSVSEEAHEEVGRYASEAGIDLFLGVGEQTRLSVENFGTHGRHFESKEALLAACHELVTENTIVLIKGSRRARMDEIASALTTDYGTAARRADL